MNLRPLVVLTLAAMPLAAVAAQVIPTPPTTPTPQTAPTPPTPPTAPVPDVTGRPGWSPIPSTLFEPFQYQANLAWEDMHVAFDKMNASFEPMNFQGMEFNLNGFGEHSGPRAPWAQGDPADSLYRAARNTINRTDYLKAALQFNEIWTKYPNSRYSPDAVYYEAFSRYRVGTAEQLRLALKALDANPTKVDYMQSKSEVPVLRSQILGALAKRGEPGAEEKLKQLKAQYPNLCDKDEINVQSSVINSLYRADPAGTAPSLKNILQAKDRCSAELRRTALYLLANDPSDANGAIIAQSAKADTVESVRQRAIDLLSRMPGDAPIAVLQELMRDPDEDIQRAAVRSLMQSDNPKARGAMRTLIDRKDAPESQRLEAIRSFDKDHATADDAAYLRGLYNRGENDKIKEAIISALGQIGGEENTNFLLTIAKNPNESSMIRSSAFRRAGSNISTDELIKLLDAQDSGTMRQAVVNALGRRKEEAATNKLLDIAKNSTDPDVQKLALRILLDSKDPAVTAKLLQLLKKP